MYIFLHFHKAAGVSVITFLQKQGLKPHNKHYNGNPWNKKGTKPIIFWDFPKKKLQRWTKKLEHDQNVGIIACEWNFLPRQNMIPSLKYITSIRDPFRRYLSNFIVERFLPKHLHKSQQLFRHGKTNKHSLHQFLNDFSNLNIKRTKRNMNFKMSYNKPNYYIRMLNNLGESPNIEINEHHLQIAKEILSKFDIIIIIDYPKSLQQLKPIFNKTSIPHNNQMKWKKPQQIPQQIVQEFKKRNRLDYQLYEYAKQLIDQRIKPA